MLHSCIVVPAGADESLVAVYKDIHAVYDPGMQSSEYRQDKLDRIRPDSARAACQTATRLIDKHLRTLGLYERDMVYSVNENGKPSFSDFPDLHFSISHTGNAVMVVFAPFTIGCDIEDDNRAARYDRLPRFFTDAEQQRIHCASEFIDVWVQKEAYAKCRGLSLADVLGTVDVEDMRGYRAILDY